MQWDHCIDEGATFTDWHNVGQNFADGLLFVTCMNYYTRNPDRDQGNRLEWPRATYCGPIERATDGNSYRRTVDRKRRGRPLASKGDGSKKICLALDAMIPATTGPKKPDGIEIADKQFSGDWAASTWNGQGLLASEAMKQHAKMRRSRELFKMNDALGLTETHGTIGKCAAVRLPPDCQAFWSHGEEGEAGVGIWLKKAFIEKICGKNKSGERIEVEKGRALIWRGGGEEGRFQIAVVYLHTGNSGGKDERQQVLRAVLRKMEEYGISMNIILGDFNFVMRQEDRFGGESEGFTGQKDKKEAETAEELLKGAGLVEVDQTDYTYRFENMRSRLDRIYANIRPFENLDRDIGCAALEWKDCLSRHRAVSAFKRSPQKPQVGHRDIDDHVFKDENWARRVKCQYIYELQQEKQTTTAIQRLLLLKRSIRSVCDSVAKERKVSSGTRGASELMAEVMRYIRALEKKKWGTARRVREGCEELEAKVKRKSEERMNDGDIKELQNWAVTLARTGIQEEILEIEKAKQDNDEQEVVRRKEHIIRRLKKMSGDTSSGIKAMREEGGRVRTDAPGIACILEEHWAKVFQAGTVDKALLQRWLEEEYPKEDMMLGARRSRKRSRDGAQPWWRGLPEESDERWATRKRDVARAIKNSKNTMPGPDGIPYRAWRLLGDTGIEAIWNAMEELKEDDAIEKLEEAYSRTGDTQTARHEFNLSTLICLPKAAVGKTEDEEDIYEAAGTRPLAIVNTDNRLMANAARGRYESIFKEWVSAMQKGFIKGRSMLSNVVTIDQAAMKISLRSKSGAIVLFDFRAAFPSVERCFVTDTLRWLGMPDTELNFVEALYNKTDACIRINGEEGDRFEMSRGIRQGCPLSPILFSVVVDILLRKLDRVLSGEGIVRAFADDTAAAIQNIYEKLPDVAKLFENYAKISGLELNLGKTLVVPLWRKGEEAEQEIEEYDELRQVLRKLGGGWEKVQIRTCAKYLGFVVGPGRDEHVWDKSVSKWEARAASWAGKGIGLQLSAMVYNTFCASVLGFLQQLVEIPVHVLNKEEEVMLKLASGPYEWANATDLWHMGEVFGIGRSFSCIQARAEAAKLRALHFENWERPMAEEEQNLGRWERETAYPDRRVRWVGWYVNAFPRILMRNEAKLRARGITMGTIKTVLVGEGGTEVKAEVFQRRLQSVATRLNMKSFGCNWDLRVEKKLKRWKLSGYRTWWIPVFRRNMSDLRNLVTPRVAAAVWSMAWNRWCTARRFQRKGRCVLGCSNCEDSIEHYIGCKHVRAIGWKMLRLEQGEEYEDRKKGLLAADCRGRDERVCLALLAYATQQTTNAARQEGSCEEPVERLKQWVRRGVEGHTASANVVRRRFLREAVVVEEPW